MKVWTVSAFTYDLVRDSVRGSGSYEDLIPFGVYMSRDGAEKAVLHECNVVRSEAREDHAEISEADVGDYSDLTAIAWTDRHYGDELRWSFFDDTDETYYIMAEKEVED